MHRGELPDRFYIQADKTRRLSGVLKGLVKETGLAKAIKHRELLSLWRDIVGEESYKLTRVVELKKGCLSIEVDSSTLGHHLANFRKEDILRELQTRYKSAFVTDIRFKLGVSTEG